MVLKEVGDHVLVYLTLNNMTGFITMPHVVLSASGCVLHYNSLTVVYVCTRGEAPQVYFGRDHVTSTDTVVPTEFQCSGMSKHDVCAMWWWLMLGYYR